MAAWRRDAATWVGYLRPMNSDHSGRVIAAVCDAVLSCHPLRPALLVGALEAMLTEERVEVVDFGKLSFVLAGSVEGWMFVFRLSASGRGFHRVYLNQAQQAFLVVLVPAFEHMGGVPGRIRYDNLKPDVVRVLKGRDRAESQRFLPCVPPRRPGGWVWETFTAASTAGCRRRTSAT